MTKTTSLESRNKALVIALSVFTTYSIVVTALFLYFNFELQQAKAERDNVILTNELLIQKYQKQ